MSSELINYQKNLLSELSALGELRYALSKYVIPYSSLLRNEDKNPNLPTNVIKSILMEEI